MADDAIQYAVTSDGVRIAYTITGNGPPLVHMPNDGVSSLLLDNALPERRRWSLALARSFTLIRYDGRGHGHSQRDVEDLSPQAFARDLEAVVAKAGIGRFVLFGFLGGSLVAPIFAAEHPEAVSHLVLWPPDTRERTADEYKGLVKLALSDWETFTETYAHLALGWDQGEAAHTYAVVMRESISHETYLRMAAQQAKTPPLQLVEQYAPRVQAPTLVLQRHVRYAADRLATFAAAFPHGRLRVLDGTQTLPYQGDIRQVVEAISTFVEAEGAVPARAASTSAAAGGLLTAREREILEMLGAGRSNQEIADELVLSVRTVERHLANIYEKIGASGKSARAAAAVYGRRPSA